MPNVVSIPSASLTASERFAVEARLYDLLACFEEIERVSGDDTVDAAARLVIACMVGLLAAR